MTPRQQEALDRLKKLSDLSSTTTIDQMLGREQIVPTMLNLFRAENPEVSESDIARALELPILDIEPELKKGEMAMAIYQPKGSLTYWIDFTYRGRRVRESAGTHKITIAREYEKTRRRELENARAGVVAETPEQRIRSVKSALKDYRESYKVNHREKSVDDLDRARKHLDRLLGSALMPDLTDVRMAEYMNTRKAEGVGPRTINMELEALSRGVGHPWKILWPKLKRLEEPHDTGRALEVEEERSLLRAAAKNWSPVILFFIKIALLTGMRLGEIRKLTWSRIDLDKRELIVGKAKTAAGTGRGIPMHAELYQVFAEQAAFVARTLDQPIEASWYVFPFMNRRRPVDPTRPVTTVKTAWESVREAAGISGFRFHDLRHTALTHLAEANTPEETLKALMGHMSRRMLERYSHIRMAAKRTAIDRLSLPDYSEDLNGHVKESPKESASERVQ